MVLNWDKATKPQLLQIALNENCPLHYKYQACSEMQMRWNNHMLTDVVRMFGKGSSALEIAEYLGISVNTVGGIISKYKLRRAN
jgi:hypothetical protein